MAQYDISTTVKPIIALNTSTIASDKTTDGVTIDMNGFNSLMFVIHTGTRTAGTLTPVIEHSDTGDFSGEEEAVEDTWLSGTEALAALSAANDIAKIGYIGKKRYVRLTLVSTGSTDAFIVSAQAILGDSRSDPQSDQTP